MAIFTTQLRSILESKSGLGESQGYNDVDFIINEARPKIFNFSYPIFDVEYKVILEKKILEHFYTQEIAFETAGLWQLKLRTKMREIMPYYNQLYNSQLLEFNPFYDVDLNRSHKRTGEESKTENNINITTSENEEVSKNTSVVNETGSIDSTNNSETDTSNNSNNTNSETGENSTAMSDTPQGQLANVYDLSYLTEFTLNKNNRSGSSETNDVGNQKINGTNNTDSRSDSNNITDFNKNSNSNVESNTDNSTKIDSLEDYFENVKGKQGSTSYSELLLKFRETFVNIDMLIIEDLRELFHSMWWQYDMQGGF